DLHPVPWIRIWSSRALSARRKSFLTFTSRTSHPRRGPVTLRVSRPVKKFRTKMSLSAHPCNVDLPRARIHQADFQLGVKAANISFTFVAYRSRGGYPLAHVRKKIFRIRSI